MGDEFELVEVDFSDGGALPDSWFREVDDTRWFVNNEEEKGEVLEDERWSGIY